MSTRLVLLACVLAGCGASHRRTEPPAEPAPPQHEPAPPIRPAFCARDNGADKIRALFCQDSQPEIRSLGDLLTMLGINPAKQGLTPEEVRLPAGINYASANYMIALGHSTSLSGQLVSPINPRMFYVSQDYALAFVRGVQHVELAFRTEDKSHLNFYLLSFEQACNQSATGCSPGDSFTPNIERDWLGVTIQDDEDLKNTALDCRQCHARGQPKLSLLMRELEAPWTHFFEPHPDTPQPTNFPGVRGRDLVKDYLSAKGDEAYGNVPTAAMRTSVALILEGLAGPQPLLFDAPKIEAERWPAAPDAEPKASPTWEAAYAAFKRGEQLALPYVDNRVTDLQKQAALTEAYTRFRAGELPAEELPDLSDIFPDDPLLRARIGLQTEPDATPAETLIQACGSCHNAVLDQSLSRARFSIDLSGLDRAALELAIERIERPHTAQGVMPPANARQLAPAARERLIAYLRQDPPYDESLARAAQLGMLGQASE